MDFDFDQVGFDRVFRFNKSLAFSTTKSRTNTAEKCTT